MSALNRCLLGLSFVGLLALACEREAEDPSAYGQPIGYDQYGNPIYARPGQPPQPGQPPPPGAPGYGQPGPQGTTSQPAGYAVPCQSDITCGAHKCNVQVGRCAFPCQYAESDCAAGLSCAAGFCVPGAGP